MKVMGFSLEFCVLSLSPLTLERFSLNYGQMFIPIRRCVELMTELRRLKVKVTIQGYRI